MVDHDQQQRSLYQYHIQAELGFKSGYLQLNIRERREADDKLIRLSHFW